MIKNRLQSYPLLNLCREARIEVLFECLLLQFKSWLHSTIGAIKGTVKALLLAPLHSLVEDSLYEILFHSTRIWDKSYDMTKQRWVYLTLFFTFLSHFWIFLVKPLSNQKLANLMSNNGAYKGPTFSPLNGKSWL